MDTLDSRSLSYIDCFGKRFSAAGQVRYRVGTASGAWLPVEGHVFTIDVKRGGRAKKEGKQHNVTVQREGKRLVADPSHLEIEVGDFVLWYTTDSSISGFALRGEGKGVTFDSSALVSDSIYTHAFGSPGEYRWVDAYGGRVSGVVQVGSVDSSQREGFEKWSGSLKKGELITINGDKATPERVHIVVGQTVFWLVEKADGISITDARLVQDAGSKQQQQQQQSEYR